jgi:hypothetical protein
MGKEIGWGREGGWKMGELGDMGDITEDEMQKESYAWVCA